MIFSVWPRVVIKLGDERHVFDRAQLMFTEVAEIEKVTELSYAEWLRQLDRHSLVAIAALLHVLRKRDGQPSDFKSMQFAAGDLDVFPLRDDGTEMNALEAAEDLQKRIAAAAAAGNGAGPTPAASGQEVLLAAQEPERPGTPMSLSSQNGTA